MEQGAIEVPKGLDKVIVDRTGIASTDSDGNLVYRGYRAVDLAEKRSFEQTAYLVMYGHLPDSSEIEDFSRFLMINYGIDDSTERIMQLMPKDTKLIDLLRSVVSLVPLKEKKDDKILIEIGAKMPRISSDGYRILKGMPILKDVQGSYAERFYYLLTGNYDSVGARYFEKILILYMEHEFNASTFTLRVAASTLTDPRAAVTAALAALKGPLHGGANAEILNYMLKMKSTDEAVKFVEDKLAKKEKIMGFGHRIYKKLDPRAQFAKEQLKSLAKLKDAEQLYDYAAAIEKAMWDKKQIPANLDFYAATCFYLLGIEESFYTPIFAASRLFGWGAHYIEQVSDNKLIRPDSKYVGPVGLEL
ncbi:MAG: citrate/2-methylcitrate synthase [Candidatus Micrarchaeota archaeon]|nr:citrate/2-methylcitrate synthase [Candidatus Micrarchaeota archaeon]